MAHQDTPLEADPHAAPVQGYGAYWTEGGWWAMCKDLDDVDSILRALESVVVSPEEPAAPRVRMEVDLGCGVSARLALRMCIQGRKLDASG